MHEHFFCRTYVRNHFFTQQLHQESVFCEGTAWEGYRVFSLLLRFAR